MATAPRTLGTNANAADDVAEGLILQSLNLERLKANEVNAVVELLEKLAVDLEQAIKKADPNGVGPSTYRQKRLKALLGQINGTTNDYYTRIKKNHDKALKGVVAAEAKATVTSVNKAFAGVQLAGLPTVSQLQAIASEALIMGAPSKEWWASQKLDLQAKFKNEIRQGMLLGESVDELVRRVRGTKVNGFKDGIINVKKHQAAALVRTSVQAVSHAARMATHQANEDLYNGYQWLSTLDGRTTHTCKARSGLTWDKSFNAVGHDKEYSPPPAHWNCRSLITPWLKDWTDLSKDKTLAAKKKKELKANGDTINSIFLEMLMRVGKRKDEAATIMRKTQASMDGQVAVDLNFEQWLATKGKGFQAQVLGAGRYNLFKEGKISLLDLVDQSGNPITLAQLNALVDQGKSALVAFNPTAQATAKAELKAKEQLQAAAVDAEDDAIAWLNDWPTQSKTKAKAYKKATKKPEWAGATLQQRKQIALDTFGQQEQIQWQALAAGKIANGKKLSPKEKAFWAKADPDYKAAKRAEANAKNAAAAAAKAKAEQEKLAAALQKDAEEKAQINIESKMQYYLSGSGDFIDENSYAYGAEIISEALEAGLINPANVDDIIENAFQAQMVFQKQAKLFEKAVGTKEMQTLVYKAIGDGGVAPFVTVISKMQEGIAKQIGDAVKELDAIIAGGKGYKQKAQIYQKFKSDSLLGGKSVTEQVAMVDAAYTAKKLAGDLASAKAKLAKGGTLNKLNPSEKAAVNSLEGQGLEDFLEQVNDKKIALAAKEATEDAPVTVKVVDNPAAAAQRADGPLMDDLEQVGGQGGSNTGGLFNNVVTGEQFYIKAPQSAVHAKVEVLSAKLYERAGVKVPQITPINLKGSIGNANVDGQLGVASKIESVDDLTVARMADMQDAADGFAADAWLANWDVVGNGAAKELNLKALADGTALRIDTGGTLFLRAQGGRKAFGGVVDELDTLRDPRMNANASEVFGKLTDEQIAIGVQRIVAIDDAAIRRMVVDAMGDDADDIAEVLIARKNYMAKRYKAQLDALSAKAKPMDVPTVGIAPAQHKAVVEGRVNGYTILADKDSIEDQQLLMWQFENGVDGLGGGISFKLRGEASAKLTTLYKRLGDDAVDTGPLISLRDLDNQLEELLRGVGALAKNGDSLRPKDVKRFEALKDKLREKLGEMKVYVKSGDYPEALITRFNETYQPWVDDIDMLFAKHVVGETFEWAPHTTAFFQKNALKIPDRIIKTVAASGSPWKVARWTPPAGEARKGKLQYDAFNTVDRRYRDGLDGKVLQYKDDFVEVNFYPDTANRAWQGQVDVRFTGGTLDDFDRALDKLTELGFDVAQSTPVQQEVLYLSRFLNIHAADRASMRDVAREALMDANDLPFDERLSVLRKAASEVMGVDDITATPMYSPSGAWEYWGNGRHLQQRPDLYGKEWDRFSSSHRLYHDLEYGGGDMNEKLTEILDGGGVIAPTTDKVRRGLSPSGASPEDDQARGGAVWAFTRIRDMMKPTDTDRWDKGIYWNASLLRRMDAVSYSQDMFGRTTGNHVSVNRAVSIKNMKQFGENWNGNETGFKNSLSIFEDIDVIVAPRAADLIKRFKAAGYAKWPDGRKLEDVIKQEGTEW